MDTPPELPPKNMRVGLMIFGILSILLGACCLLMAPAMFLSTLVPVKGQDPTPMSMVLPGALFYVAIAIINVWLGVGSIQCKRWARSLMLLWAIFWLLGGVFAIIGFGLASGQIDTEFAKSAQPMPAGFTAGFKIAMFLFLFLFEIVMPASFVWFYSLGSTRLTCENRHPSPAWTDHCPLPVLALALLMGMMALCMPFTLVYARAFPFFGFYIGGLSAMPILLVLCVLSGWSGWGLYHLKKSAWVTGLVLMLLLSASYIITFNHGGLMEMYRHMNLPAQSMKVLEASPILKSSWIGWACTVFVLPYVGLMFYVRKYFFSTPPAH